MSVNKKPTDYKQYDRRWANVDYNSTKGNGKGSTIRNSGCGPTSAADIASKFVNSSITPKTVATWMQSHGYKCPSGGTYSTAFAAYFKTLGITCERITGTTQIYGRPNSKYIKEAFAELDKGNYVIALMGKGTWTKGGHFICVYGYDKNKIYVCDPASTKSYRLKGDLATWKKQIKELFVVHIADYKKTSKKEEPKKGLTKKQKFVKGLQKSLNQDYKCGLTVDHSYGPKTEKALSQHNIKKGCGKYCATHLQYWLKRLGFKDNDGKELAVDGDFGKKSVEALKNAQKKLGIKQDGVFGAGTCEKFMKLF